MVKEVARKRARRSAAPKNNPPWDGQLFSLSIENLGRVASGHLELAPFTILVGKNNTGKSYVASLVWAILRRRGITSAEGRRGRTIPSLSNALANLENVPSELSFDLTDADWRSAEVAIQATLRDKGYYTGLFAFPEMETPKVVFKFDRYAPFRITVIIRQIEYDRYLHSLHVDTNDTGATLHINLGTKPRDGERGTYDTFFIDTVLNMMLNGPRSDFFRSPIYIPAARTGLMVAFQPLVSSVLGTLGIPSRAEKSISLPAPIVAFLQSMAFTERTAQNALGPNIAQELEADILGGSVTSTGGPNPEFSYSPSGSNMKIPLHVTSSMITELAPFLLMLRGNELSGFIFEEPEAHLHIAAQRKIAIAIARLVNHGIPMVVTTHSDTFLQQINTLIHLHSHQSNRRLFRELGYKTSDVIDPARAKAYEFVEENSSTTFREVEKRREGFVVPSLNDTLFEIAKEVLAVQAEELE